MILGIGCDIVNITRLEQGDNFLEHFRRKILGGDELNELKERNIKDTRILLCTLAKYYAAKEAFAKALGIGFRDGIYLSDIQILHDYFGKPNIKVSGKALEYMCNLSVNAQVDISLSDDYPFALAYVVISD